MRDCFTFGQNIHADMPDRQAFCKRINLHRSTAYEDDSVNIETALSENDLRTSAELVDDARSGNEAIRRIM
ncbi:hypothetical protein AAFF_G00057200 [Aldrovandia affinis]|uniref:Uncharacterized protein n=1 Tax=Aldrovandia affinis TaxID=143900 RepID=A0AAD7S0N5_9TELE|nr:hypothetical protein AAFF_G00057200 [Aldrovandia affinis]